MEYQAFICSGTGENYSERGAYTCDGDSYTEAAKNFGEHWNRCTVSNTYGTQWKEAGKGEGLPKNHCYVTDDKGNKLLLIQKK